MADTAHAVAHPPTSTGLEHVQARLLGVPGSETLFFGSLISTYMVYKNESVVGRIRPTSSTSR